MHQANDEPSNHSSASTSQEPSRHSRPSRLQTRSSFLLSNIFKLQVLPQNIHKTSIRLLLKRPCLQVSKSQDELPLPFPLTHISPPSLAVCLYFPCSFLLYYSCLNTLLHKYLFLYSHLITIHESPRSNRSGRVAVRSSEGRTIPEISGDSPF
jgi:hypothetical protein